MIPTDLVPLPTMPYDERPVALPLDIEECRTALWMVRGNISKAAEILKVSSKRLRSFVKSSKYLVEEVKEAQEKLLDTAEDVAFEALTDDEDKSRRDTMARFVLTNLGAERGFGTSNGKGGVNINMPGKGKMEITWGDGSSIQPEKVIEHESH